MENTTTDLLHQEISQSLIDWAANNGVESDHIVQSLMQDLANEENLAIWAVHSFPTRRSSDLDRKSVV